MKSKQIMNPWINNQEKHTYPLQRQYQMNLLIIKQVQIKFHDKEMKKKKLTIVKYQNK